MVAVGERMVDAQAGSVRRPSAPQARTVVVDRPRTR